MISVIIPVFNKKNTLPACLDSVLNNKCKDREIIAIDDGSNDGSLQILRKYAQKGVIIVELNGHRGICDTCQVALSMAQGDIVVRTDADTVVEPDWLELFKNHFLGKDVVAVGGSYACLNNDSTIALCTSTIDLIFVNLLKRRLLFNKLPGANRAIRKDVLLSIGGFGKQNDLNEDIGIFSKLKKKKFGKIIFDPHIVVKTQYPADMRSLWTRHYKNGCGMVAYLKHPKIWIRPLIVTGFYFALASSFFNLFILRKLELLIIIFLIFYLGFLAAVSICSLWLLPKKKILFAAVPPVFIFQNTAYTFGMFNGLLQKLRFRS